MTSVLPSLCDDSLEALHYADDYIPKKAIRYFLEGSEERVSLLIREMEQVLDQSEEYAEDGTMLPYFGIMILGALRREEGLDLIKKMGHLSAELFDALVDGPIFDSFSLAIAELYRHTPADLKKLIENTTLNTVLRAAALHAMVCLFGQKSLTRQEVVHYFKQCLAMRKEKIPLFYDVIATSSYVLHPEELIGEIRSAHKAGFFDQESVDLREIEAILDLPKEEIIQEGQEALQEDLSDLLGHLDSADLHSGLYERNDACPCGSGHKYKKCCS